MNLVARAHDEPACGGCHACSRFHVRASGPRAQMTASAIGAGSVAARMGDGLMTGWAMTYAERHTAFQNSTAVDDSTLGDVGSEVAGMAAKAIGAPVSRGAQEVMTLVARTNDEPACCGCHAWSRFHVRASGPRGKMTPSAIGARTIAARMVSGLMTAWAMP